MPTTVEQTYQKYKIKTESNITNDGIATDRGRFVEQFNEQQIVFEEMHLQQRAVDDIRYIQKFLVLGVPIEPSKRAEDKEDFDLPLNYLDIAGVKAKASKEKCKQKDLYLFEVQTEDLSEILQDSDNKPSFLWREAPYTVNNNTVSVYTAGDFSVDKILLDYYRYPQAISLQDPLNPESGFNESYTIEWDDKSLNRIISMCAEASDINENNPRFQLQKLRQQKQ